MALKNCDVYCIFNNVFDVVILLFCSMLLIRWHLHHLAMVVVRIWRLMMVLGRWHMMWYHRLTELMKLLLITMTMVFCRQLLNLKLQISNLSHTGHRWCLMPALFYHGSPIRSVCLSRIITTVTDYSII